MKKTNSIIIGVFMRFQSVVLLFFLLVACSGEDRSAITSVQTSNSVQSSETKLASSVALVSSEVLPAPGLAAESSLMSIPVEASKSEVVKIGMRFEATDPNAPIEAAVLYGGVVIPVLSIPTDSQQILDISSRDVFSDELIENCSGSGGNRCISLVAKHHHMSSIPDSWFDAKGKVYKVDGDVIGRSNIGIGFKLRHADIKSENPNADDRVLLSREEGFTSVRVLPHSEWQSWPEFRQELQSWANQHLSICKTVECKQAIDRLSLLKNSHGEAREFKFSDGRKLQFLHAKSKTEGGGVLVKKPDYVVEDHAPTDTLKTNLWRLVNTDGSARVLKISGGSWMDELGSTKLDYPYCDSQCGPSWIDIPEVISAKGRTFMFGPYAGGTVSGYLFFEVLPTELKFLGWYRWGS